jgi:uncharacterized protein
LLRIDEENTENMDRDSWEKCGLEYKPFENVKYLYPFTNMPSKSFSQSHLESPVLEKQHVDGKALNFIYTYKEHKDKLDLLFSNIEDSNHTIESILGKIMEDRDFDVSNWKDLMNRVSEYTKAKTDKDKDIPVVSWRRFSRLLKSGISNHVGNLFQNSKSPDKKHKHTFLSDEIQQIKSGETYVVDIASIEEQLQYLIFGDIIDSVYKLKNEGRDDEHPVPSKIIIFVDELNKYAPANSKSSPILNLLLEIAERGRSMGIILFSAEQFKSAVHNRITGNSGTHIYGRTNSIEVGKKDYSYLPDTFKAMMTRLEKGELILQHPIFRTLLKIKFPRPSYYQSKE